MRVGTGSAVEHAEGLVEKVNRGKYKITKDGSDLITDERIVDVPDPELEDSEK